MVDYPHNALELPTRFKDMSRALLAYAVETGLIKRPYICQHCGAFCTPDAHHTNYFEPLNVVWLCKPCHAAQHPARRQDVRISTNPKPTFKSRSDRRRPFDYLDRRDE